MTKQYEYTWEQAVDVLRQQPEHQKLIHESYLSDDLLENCRRFHSSEEFAEVLSLVRTYRPNAQHVLDMPAGNGIGSFAFAREGYSVTSIEPDPSASVGRGAVQFVLQQHALANVQIVEAYGEELPLPDAAFDVAYIRQGLHHARNMTQMLAEVIRVLKPGGIVIATREPVVDDYEQSLKTFLDAQPDHKLYGGENAFTHSDYLKALRQPGLEMISDLGPYDSIINLFPKSFEELRRDVLNSTTGRLLKLVMPSSWAYRTALAIFKKRNREPGRLHSFLARKR